MYPLGLQRKPLEEDARPAAKWGKLQEAEGTKTAENPVRDPVSKKNPRARSDRSPGVKSGRRQRRKKCRAAAVRALRLG